MANSALDSNNNPTITALLNTDGTTITRIKGDPNSHRMNISDSTGGTDHGGTHAFFDDNDRTSLIAVSNGDGITITSLYCDSSGRLLVNSM